MSGSCAVLASLGWPAATRHIHTFLPTTLQTNVHMLDCTFDDVQHRRILPKDHRPGSVAHLVKGNVKTCSLIRVILVPQGALVPVRTREELREALWRLEEELRRLDREQGGGHTAAADMVAFYAATTLWFTAEKNYKVCACGHMSLLIFRC